MVDTLLQIPLSDEQLNQRLELTAPMSKRNKPGEELTNCANLVLVLLGLIDNPIPYLLKCTSRERPTQEHELDTVVTEAFREAEVTYKGAAYTDILGSHAVLTKNYYFLTMHKLVWTLAKGYATPLGITFEGGVNHLTILRKKKNGNVEFIDPQDVMPDGSYPFRKSINPFLFFNLYFPVRITALIYFNGPILPIEKQALAVSTLGESLMNEASKFGGKRKTRSKKRKHRRTRRSG
jgi:hypothetical protein